MVLVLGVWLAWLVAQPLLVDWAFARLETDFGVAGRAGRVQIQPMGLGVVVEDLALAATGAEDTPFLTVARASVDLPWGVVTGARTVDLLELVDPALTIRRTVDGGSNLPVLPPSDPAPASSDPPWRVRVVGLQGGRVVWDDRSGAIEVVAGGIELALAPEAGSAASGGTLRVDEPVHVSRETVQTRIEPFAAPLVVDGATVTLSELALTAVEGRLEVAGVLTGGDAGLELDMGYRLDVDLSRVGAWLPAAAPLAGALSVEGRVEGPAGAPAVTAALRGDDLGWDQFEAGGLTLDARWADGRLDVGGFRVDLAGGQVTGTARVAPSAGATSGNVDLAWADLDLGSLVSGWAPDALPVASTLHGALEAAWTGHAPGDWVLRIDSRHQAPRDAVTTGLSVEGRWRGVVERSGWQVTVERLRSGATSLGGELRGALPDSLDAWQATGIEGRLRADVSSLAELETDLRRLGFDGLPEGAAVTGTGVLTADLAGTVGAPLLTGSVEASGAAIGRPGLVLQAGVSNPAGGWSIDPLDLRLAEAQMTGRLTLEGDTGRLGGGLRLRVPDLGLFGRLTPAGWGPGGELDIEASLGGDLEAPRFEGRVVGTDVTLAGQRVTSVEAELVVQADEVAVESLVVRQDEGRLEGAGRFAPGSGRYQLSAAGQGLRVSPWTSDGAPPIPVTAELDLELDAAGALADPTGRAEVFVRSLAYDRFDIAPSAHTISLDGGRWRLRSTAPEYGVSADLEVGDASPWPYELDAQLTGTQLPRLLELAGVTLAGDGEIDLAVRATGAVGSSERPTVTADLTRLDARVAGMPLSLVGAARARLLADQLRLDQPLTLRLGDTRLTVDGSVGGSGAGGVRATLDGDLRDVTALWEGAAAERTTPVGLSGPFRVEVGLTGPLAAPALTASLRLDDGVVEASGIPALTDLAVRAAWDEAGLTLNSLQGAWREAALEASGAVSPGLLAPWLPAPLAVESGDPGRASLETRVTGLQPANLAEWLDAPALTDVGGGLGVELRLETDRLDAAAVRGTVALPVLDLSLAGVPLRQQDTTRLTLADGRLEVGRLSWEVGSPENRLTLGGHVDLTVEPTADLTVTGTADLRVLNIFSPTTPISGDALLVANLSGTLAAPSVDGAVEISAGELRIPEPRLQVSDLNGALVFQGTTMRPVELTATANGGAVQLGGEVRFPGLRPEGTLTLRSEAIPLVLPPGVRTEIETDLTLALDPDDLALTGTVTVLRGDYREGVDTAGGLRALLESGSESAVLEQEPSLLDEVRLDVRVVTADDIVVDNNYGSGNIQADTRAVGTVGRPGLTGRLTVGDGAQIFLGGNTFEVETGTVDFVDPDGIVPELDVTARTQVGPEEITITLDGTAETLTTTMQSSSNLPESDIVSLLLTGRTLDQVGQAPGAVARDQALGLVSGEVLGAAGRSVGLDTVRLDRGSTQGDVRFDPSLVAGDTNPGTRLTVGKNLSRQVELVASQNLRDAGLITWIVNYLPQRNVELRLVVDDEADRSYEFRHVLSFGRQTARGRTAPRREEPRVTAVRVVGATEAERETLDALVRLEPGDRFDFRRWQDSRDRIEQRLWALGYQEARVRTRRVAGDAPGTVELEFEIDRGLRSVLVVQGYEPPGRLLRDMEAAWRGSVFDAFLREELELLVRRHLVAQGYPRPVVTAVVDAAGAAEGEKRIVVEADPGPRSFDLDVEFVGHELLSEARLRALATPDRVVDAWAGGDELVEVVVNVYRTEGRLEAAAAVGEPRFEGDIGSVVVRIDEGRGFEIAEVTIDGGDRWTAAEIRTAAGLEAGRVYRAGAADMARANLLAAYRADGFSGVRVRVRPDVDFDAARVVMRVTVDEGRRQLLDSVAVEGGTGTHPELIERALRLTPGVPVDPAVWNQARKRLYDTGVFRSVDITAVPLAGAPATARPDQPVVARVTLEERPRYQLRYGLQMIDEQDPAGTSRGQFGVVADLSRRNLLGRGITVGSAARFDTVQQAGRGFLVFPSFLGRAITSNLFVSRIHETFGEVGAKAVSQRNRLTLEQQIKPAEGVTVSYSYNFDRDHTFDQDFDPNDPFAFDLTVDIARLSSSLVVERRDDLFDATSGWFHASTVEWGAERFGSDLRFLKYLVQQYYFRPVGRGLVLASAARVGLGAGFGQELIPSERFFAGGGTTVRGYAQDGLGPVDFFGDASGGSASVVFNQELRFPLAGLFRGVGFLDAGNVFDSVRDVSFRDLKVALGIGVRAATPVGLFRVDYGFPLSGEDDEPVGRWFFSIGQAF